MNKAAESQRLRTELRNAIAAQTFATDKGDWAALQSSAISAQHIAQLLTLLSTETTEGISKA